MTRYLSLLSLAVILSYGPSLAQSLISVDVRDSHTGCRLVDAIIYNNQAGIYQEYRDTSGPLTLLESSLEEIDTLYVSRLGYVGQALHTSVFSLDSSHTLYLTQIEQQEIMVTAQRLLPDFFVVNKLGAQEMEQLVHFGGEKDVIRSLSILPSVEEGGDGLAVYNVRGSGSEQNGILVDGVPLLAKTGTLELFSAVPSNSLAEIQFFPGVFPSNYGGRLASFADLKTYRHLDSMDLDVVLSPLLSSIDLKVPLLDQKIGFLANFRIMPPLLYAAEGTLKETLNSSYSRYNSGLTVASGLVKTYYRSRGFYLGLTYLRNQFNLEYADNFNFIFSHQKNRSVSELASMQWELFIAPKLLLSGTMGYSTIATRFIDFDADTYQDGRYEHWSESLTSIKTMLIKAHVDAEFEITSNWYLLAGTERQEYVTGEYTETTGEESFKTPLINSSLSGHYFVTQYRNPTLSAKGGVRLENYSAHKFNHTSILPYLELERNFENWTFNLGLNQSRQYEHEFTDNQDLLSWQIYRNSTIDHRPQKASIASIGALYTDRPNALLFSAEIYYKRMSHQILYLSPPLSFSLEGLERYLWSQRKSKSYGVEAMISKKWNINTSSLTLNLYNAQQKFDDLNNGQWFDFKYNRQISANMFHSLSLSQRYSLNLAAHVRGGFLVTMPVGFSPQGITHYSYPIYADVNNYRLPLYHRVDVGMSWRFPKKSLRHTMKVNVFNVYARKNPVNFHAYYQVDADNQPELVLERRNSFTIFPSLDIKLTYYEKRSIDALGPCSSDFWMSAKL